MLIGGSDGSTFANFLRRFLNHEFEQTVINISLSVVVGAILISIILSLMFPKTAANSMKAPDASLDER
jgi:hypothetical protein